jgi:hypothetical protein
MERVDKDRRPTQTVALAISFAGPGVAGEADGKRLGGVAPPAEGARRRLERFPG